VAFLLFGLKILTTDYSKKEWAWIILFGLLGTMSYLTCREELVIRMVMMAAASRNIDWKKIGKCIFYFALAGTLVIVALSLLGIMGEASQVRQYREGIETTRWCLGFSHANNVHDMLWYLVALYLMIYRERCRLTTYLLLTAGNIGLYLLTDSRTGFLTVQLLIIVAALVTYFPGLNRKIWLPLISVFTLAAAMALTLVGGLNGQASRFVYLCDKVLNWRLEMVWENAPVRSWTWLSVDRTALSVDNGYAKLFYCYGILVGVAYLLVTVWLAYGLCRKGDGVAQGVLMTAIMVTFMESTFIFNTSLLCNMTLILLFVGLWQEPKEKRTKQSAVPEG
jgi:hypothetical protein